MILFTDGANYDDTAAFIFLLKLNVKIDLVVITPNGWSHAGPALEIFTYISRWFGKEFPIIIGSFYALKDLDENREIPDSFPQGQMFGRTIPLPFLYELSTSYSYISWLPPAELNQITQDPAYMEKILAIIENLEEVDILSLGALTDVALLTRRLSRSNQLGKIKRIYHLGGGIDIEGTVIGVDRSKKTSYNNYLDPDAAQECLERVGKKMYWISPTASASVQFSLRDLEGAVSRHLTPEGIWFYITTRARLILSEDVPEGQLPDRLVLWDVIGVILMENPEWITCVRPQYLNMYTGSSVSVCRTRGENPSTCVTYGYDDRLGEMYSDQQNGFLTHVIYGIDQARVSAFFYEILGSEDHTALCSLRKPLGCYQSEEVTEIPPLLE